VSRRFAVVAIGLLTAGLALPSAAAAGRIPTDGAVPDLRMMTPGSFRVCGAPTSGTFQTENCPDASSNDRWLRFDSILMNVGAGPFKVVANRTSTAEDHMHAAQWIRKPAGAWRKVPTNAILAWAQLEDGHPHWHTQGMEQYRLFKLPSPFPGGALVGVKHGYCFFDGMLIRPDLVATRPTPLYSFYSCGLPGQSQDALKLTVGLSVGWADEYPWNYAGQRIDISGVDDGEYLVCLTADPSNDFLELKDTNNEAWAHVELITLSNPYRVQVHVMGAGRTPCQTQVPYSIPPLAVS